MTKIEFLQQLYNLLGVLPAEERDDIIADFEEHFSVGNFPQNKRQNSRGYSVWYGGTNKLKVF